MKMPGQRPPDGRYSGAACHIRNARTEFVNTYISSTHRSGHVAIAQLSSRNSTHNHSHFQRKWLALTLTRLRHTRSTTWATLRMMYFILGSWG